MIALLTRRPERFAGAAESLAELGPLRCIAPDQSASVAGLARDARRGLALVDYHGPQRRQDLLRAARSCRDRPVTLLLEELDGEELAALASGAACPDHPEGEGFRFFLRTDELFAPGAAAKLHQMVLRHESRRFVQQAQSYLLDNLLREEALRTRSLLDALDVGVMALSAGRRAEDRIIERVNGALEILCDAELSAFEGRPAGELLESPLVETAVRRLFRVPPRAGPRESFLFAVQRAPGERPLYLERVLNVLQGETGEPAGALLLFQDLSDAVESGWIDRATGLVSRDSFAADALRRLRRMERMARIRVHNLALFAIELEDYEVLREKESEAAAEYALRLSARTILQALHGGASLCRYARNQLLAAAPGLDEERARSAASRLASLLEGVRLAPDRALRTRLAAVQGRLPEDFGASGEGDAEAARWEVLLRDRRQELEQTLHRAGRNQEPTFYTSGRGYSSIAALEI